MSTKDSFSESLRQRLQDAPQVDITQEESQHNVMTLQSVISRSQSNESESSSNKQDVEINKQEINEYSDEQESKEVSVEQNINNKQISEQLNSNAQKLVSDIIKDILGVLIGIRDDLIERQDNSDEDNYSYSDEDDGNQYSYSDYNDSNSEYESVELDNQNQEEYPEDLSTTEDSFRGTDGFLLSKQTKDKQCTEQKLLKQINDSRKTSSRAERKVTSFDQLLQNKIKLEQLRQYNELSSLTNQQQFTQQNIAQLLQQNQQAQVLFSGLAGNVTLSQLTQLINTAIEQSLDKRFDSKKKSTREKQSKQQPIDQSVFDRLSKPKHQTQTIIQKSKIPKPQKQISGRLTSPYNLIKMSTSSQKSQIATAGTLQLSSPNQETQHQLKEKNKNVRSIGDISHISRLDNQSVADELSNAEVVYISNLIDDLNASQKLKEKNIQLSAQRFSKDGSDKQESEDEEEIDELQNTKKQQIVQKQIQRPKSSSQQTNSQNQMSKQQNLENTFDRAILSNRELNEEQPEFLQEIEYNKPKDSYKQRQSSQIVVPHSSPHAGALAAQRIKLRSSLPTKSRSNSNTQNSQKLNNSSKQQSNKIKAPKTSLKIQHTLEKPSSIITTTSPSYNQNMAQVHSPKRVEKQKLQQHTKSEIDRARLRREVQLSHSNLRNKVTALESEKAILEKDLAAYRAANISNTKHMSEEYKALKLRFQATNQELDTLKLQYQQSLNDARHKNIELNKKLIKEANFLMDQLSKHTGNSVQPSPIRPISYGSIHEEERISGIKRKINTGIIKDTFTVVDEPDEVIYKQKHIIESGSSSPVRAISEKLEQKHLNDQKQHQKHKIVLPPDTDCLQYSRTHHDMEKEVEISDIDYSTQQKIEIEHQKLQPLLNSSEQQKRNDEQLEQILQQSNNNVKNNLNENSVQYIPQNNIVNTFHHNPIEPQQKLTLSTAKNLTASFNDQKSPMTALSTISQPDNGVTKSAMIDDVPIQVANLKRIIQNHISTILKSESNAKDVQLQISHQVQESLNRFKKMEEKTEQRIEQLKLNDDEAVILRAKTKSKITAAIDELCKGIVQQIQMRVSMNQIRDSKSLTTTQNPQVQNQQVEMLAKELSDSIGDIFQLKKSLVMPDVQHLRGITALSTNPTSMQQQTLENTMKKPFVEESSNNIQIINYRGSETGGSQQEINSSHALKDQKLLDAIKVQNAPYQESTKLAQSTPVGQNKGENVTPTQLKNSIRNNYQIMNTIQQKLYSPHSTRRDTSLQSSGGPKIQDISYQIDKNQQQVQYDNTVYEAPGPSQVDNTIRNTSYTNLAYDNSINEPDTKVEGVGSQYIKSMIYSRLEEKKNDPTANSEEISEIVKPIETIGIYSILYTPELDVNGSDEIKVTDILKREVGCLNAVPVAFIPIQEQSRSDVKIQHAFSVGIKQTPQIKLLQAKILLVGFYNYGIPFIHAHVELFNNFSRILDDNKIYKQLVFIWSIYQFITETSEKMFQINYNTYLSSIQRIAIDCQNEDSDNLQYILTFNSVYLTLKEYKLKISEDILQTIGRITLQILEFQYHQPPLQYLSLISCGIYLMVQLTDKVINSQLQTKMCNTAGYLIQQYKELRYFKGYKQLFETQGIQ